jgi:hypothetical protein
MYTITIECSTTLKRVEVDIDAKNETLGAPYPVTVRCPSCGKMHHWRQLQVLGLVPPEAVM